MSKRALDLFDQALKEMFEESQAKLPEDLRLHPNDKEMCLDENDGYKCTRKKGHDGKYHSACGMTGMAHKWPVDPIIEMRDKLEEKK
jgi:hypothetical protein